MIFFILKNIAVQFISVYAVIKGVFTEDSSRDSFLIYNIFDFIMYTMYTVK